MGPYISPWVPIIKSVPSASPGEIPLASRIVKHAHVLLLLLPSLVLSTSVLVAQTPAQVQLPAQTFWTVNKWYVVIAVVTFIVQAFLIVRLLITQSKRRQAEIESHRSEDRFAKAFRANPQPMSLTTIAEGRYIDVNDSFLAMCGYARDEVIGHSSLELGIWETPGHRTAFIQRLKEDGFLVN